MAGAVVYPMNHRSHAGERRSPWVETLLSPDNKRKTIDLVKKYPDRFVFGTDIGHTNNRKFVKNSHDCRESLWQALTPKEKRMIQVDTFTRIADKSARE